MMGDISSMMGNGDAYPITKPQSQVPQNGCDDSDNDISARRQQQPYQHHFAPSQSSTTAHEPEPHCDRDHARIPPQLFSSPSGRRSSARQARQTTPNASDRHGRLRSQLPSRVRLHSTQHRRSHLSPAFRRRQPRRLQQQQQQQR